MPPLSTHRLYCMDKALGGVSRQDNTELRLSSVMMAMS
jgi:hypothetical protein